MTAVEWLVDKILVEVDKCDDEGNIIGIDYWNAYKGCVNLLEYVNKAKRLEKQQLIEMHDKGFDSVQQLNDDYAISFALFLSTECETNGDKDGWWFYNKTWKTTNELLEIFKKEKYA
jgi:uncharacterized protein YuzE